MDHAAVAKRIREAIFDHAESEGRVIQDSIDGVIEAVLRNEVTENKPWGSPSFVVVSDDGTCTDTIYTFYNTEWR